MKTAIAKNSWFTVGDIRLNASYYLGNVNLYKLQIKKSPLGTNTVGYFAEKIFYGGRAKRNYVLNKNKGIPFIGSSDMLKSDLSKSKFISKKLTQNLKDSLLEVNWVLISRSGTVGNTAFTNKVFHNKAASEHIIRLIPNTKIKPGFLYAYLSSKFGYSFLTQGVFGAVIQHIEPEHIAKIMVPIFASSQQEAIHKLVIQAGELRFEANNLFEEALKVFETAIGLTQVSISCQIDNINIKNIQTFQSRFDASYQLVTKKLNQEKRKNISYKKISELASKIHVGNRAKRNYVVNGLSFLSSSDMMLFNPKRYGKRISFKTIGLRDLLVKQNTILISRSGTVGNTVIVGEDISNTAVSEHALRLEIDPAKVNPFYVYCYLNTRQGKIQMEASAFGSVIITLNEELIGNIEIPILSDLETVKIVENISNYQKNIDLAVKYENQAIQLVETEIAQWQQ